MDTKRVEPQEPKVVEAVQGLVSENLDRVEAHLDSTVDSAKETVHELRTEAHEVADKTLTRFKASWGRMQDKLDAQMNAHPWLLMGSLLVVAYFMSRSQRSRRSP
jgi:ElaB/YqjD/DUF883 family membrane-anchored ribosome-binding protein